MMAAICTPCARERGGQWPTGHHATWYRVRCDYCGEERDCTQPRDWRELREKEEGEET